MIRPTALLTVDSLAGSWLGLARDPAGHGEDPLARERVSASVVPRSAPGVPQGPGMSAVCFRFPATPRVTAAWCLRSRRPVGQGGVSVCRCGDRVPRPTAGGEGPTDGLEAGRTPRVTLDRVCSWVVPASFAFSGRNAMGPWTDLGRAGEADRRLPSAYLSLGSSEGPRGPLGRAAVGEKAFSSRPRPARVPGPASSAVRSRRVPAACAARARALSARRPPSVGLSAAPSVDPVRAGRCRLGVNTKRISFKKKKVFLKGKN